MIDRSNVYGMHEKSNLHIYIDDVTHTTFLKGLPKYQIKSKKIYIPLFKKLIPIPKIIRKVNGLNKYDNDYYLETLFEDIDRFNLKKSLIY